MEKTLSVSRELELLTVGKLQGQKSSGIFLSPKYLEQLLTIHNAASLRLKDIPLSNTPDALKRLMVTLDSLLVSFVEATSEERSAESQALLKQIESFRAEIYSQWKQ